MRKLLGVMEIFIIWLWWWFQSTYYTNISQIVHLNHFKYVQFTVIDYILPQKLKTSTWTRLKANKNK